MHRLILDCAQPRRAARRRRENWARLIRKVYEVDPLTCTACGEQLRVVAFIEQFDVIEKTLRHIVRDRLRSRRQ